MYILFSTLGREQLNLDRIRLNKVYSGAIGDGSTGYHLLSKMTLEFKLLQFLTQFASKDFFFWKFILRYNLNQKSFSARSNQETTVLNTTVQITVLNTYVSTDFCFHLASISFLIALAVFSFSMLLDLTGFVTWLVKFTLNLDLKSQFKPLTISLVTS